LRLLLIVIFCCLQAATWWAADAFGISLVWCGQQGFIYLTLIDIFRRRKEELFAAYEVILSASATCLGAVAITYYAIFFPLITTIAHLLAVFVGMVLGLVLLSAEKMKVCQKKDG